MPTYIQWAKLWGENLYEGFFGPQKTEEKGQKRKKAFLPSGDNWLFPPNVKMGKYCVYVHSARHCHWVGTKKKWFLLLHLCCCCCGTIAVVMLEDFFGALDRTNSVSPIGRLIKGGGKYTDFFLNAFLSRNWENMRFVGRLFFVWYKNNKKQIRNCGNSYRLQHCTTYVSKLRYILLQCIKTYHNSPLFQQSYTNVCQLV